MVVSVQASVGATQTSFAGVFARRWIAMASETKVPSAVLQELNAIGYQPIAYSSKIPPPPAPAFPLLNLYTAISEPQQKQQQSAAAASSAAAGAQQQPSQEMQLPPVEDDLMAP